MTDYGGDITEGQRQGMVVGLGGRGAGGNRAMSDEGVLAEAAGNHCVVCCRAEYLQSFYRGGEDGGIQKVPTVVSSRTQPHTGRAEMG